MVFFLTPDDSLEEGQKEKALLDAEELQDVDIAPDKDKVELDLEDAPFLEDDEDEEEEEEQAPSTDLADIDGTSDEQSFVERAKQWVMSHKIMAAAIAGGILFLLIIFIYLLLTRTPPPPVPDLPPEEKPVQKQVEDEPEEKEFLVSLAPFWVEYKDEKGKIRLLTCKFTAATPNEKLAFEIKGSKITRLRDAIYYYLRNKELTFLADKRNEEVLKKELLSVLNQHLSHDRLNTLLIEEYLIK